MKVIDNALRGISFDNLGVGATFKYRDDYFIKTKMISDASELVNAINLEEGTVAYFDGSEEIIPFECELIVL